MALKNLFGDIALDATVRTIRDRMASLGQKHMVGSMPVTLADDQSAIPISGAISLNIPAAINYTNRISAVPMSGTQIILSLTVAGYKFRGYMGNGTQDGFFVLFLDGIELYSHYDAAQRGFDDILPNPQSLTGLLELKVTNNGLGNGDFFGAILGQA